jgi:hypothetical protein
VHTGVDAIPLGGGVVYLFGTRGGVRVAGPMGAPASEYDHDRISLDDLRELGLASGVCGASSGSVDPSDFVPASSDNGGDTFVVDTSDEGDAAGGLIPVDISVTPLLEAGPGLPGRAETAVSRQPDQALGIPGGPGLGTGQRGEVTVEDSPAGGYDEYASADEEWLESDDLLGGLWYEEVPDAPEEKLPETRRDGVGHEERAAQLATMFLRREDLPIAGNLDLLVDIIRHRGWSSVQAQVRGLVEAGYEIWQIYRMFELTEAWLHCVGSDELVPEFWRTSNRLTWLEAAQLLDFIGYEAELEQVADFLSVEHEIWQGLRRPTGQLASFKGYLFRYRLSSRTHVDEDIWQTNLDARDGRSFDGTRNPLHEWSWWEDPHNQDLNDLRMLFGVAPDVARIADWLAADQQGIL